MTLAALSIVMSAYNAERYIGLAIESILAQTFDDFEFLILDDGSTDQTVRIVEQFAERDGRIRLTSRENRGLVASLNELLHLARAPLVARMDADDIAYPDRLAKQMAYMEAHPDCGVLGTWAQCMDEDGELLAGQLYTFPTTPDEARAKIGWNTLVLHPSVVYRRELVLQAGGYNPAFRHCEDFELWLRLSQMTDICSLPEPLLKYREHETSISKRHVVEQRVNAGIALHAWKLRNEGLPDPTATATRLPEVGEIDTFFGQAGIEKAIVARVVPHFLYSRSAFLNDGLPVIRAHLKHGNDAKGLWRAVARLFITFKEWRAALALLAILAKPGPMKFRRREQSSTQNQQSTQT